MESISIWIAELCVCAAAVSLAEQLLPEGNVKKAVYFVMGLMIVTSFVSPITHMEKLEFSKPDNSLTLNENTDWFNRITEDLFQKEVEKIIKENLSEKKIDFKKIEIYTDINEDNCIFIEQVRITVGEEFSDRVDEIEDDISKAFNTQADVTVK